MSGLIEVAPRKMRHIEDIRGIDQDHNRTIIRLRGEPEIVREWPSEVEATRQFNRLSSRVNSIRMYSNQQRRQA